MPNRLSNNPLRLAGARPDVFNDVNYFNDFVTAGGAAATGPVFASTADVAHFLVTLVNSALPTAPIDAGPGGIIRFGVTGTNGDKISAQLNGEGFITAAGKDITFHTRIRTSAIAGTTLFVGLNTTDTTILAGTTDQIGFAVPSVGGSVNALTRASGTATTTSAVATLVNATWVDLAVEVQGTGMAIFYVDGVEVARHTTNIPTGALTLSVEGVAAASTAFNLDLDWIYVSQTR